MTELAGHLLLFGIVACLALAVPLMIGRLLRPDLPNAEKTAIYECGERTIGSSRLQFDLRFYVVALLFIVFDVEIAFFFPWATVFGTATALSDERLPLPSEARQALSESLLSVPPGRLPESGQIDADAARLFAVTALSDLLVFFAVLLVGFAYVWKRGDLDWVRAVSEQVRRTAPAPAWSRVDRSSLAPVMPFSPPLTPTAVPGPNALPITVATTAATLPDHTHDLPR